MKTWIANENLTHDGKFAGSYYIWTNEHRTQYVGEVISKENCQLATAAPELLAALDSIIKMIGPYMGQGRMDVEIAAARAAISKARGV